MAFGQLFLACFLKIRLKTDLFAPKHRLKMIT